MKKEIKTNAMRKLDDLGISYELVDYDLDGEFKSAKDIAEHGEGDMSYIFKTLATIANTNDIYIFVIPGEESLDFKKGARAVGVKNLEMLNPKDLKSKIGYERGATTSLAMKKDYPVIIDSRAESMDIIGISAGQIGYGLKINPYDLSKANDAQFFDVIK